MVECIEHCGRFLKVRLKPRKGFPYGVFFYTDAAAENLVRSRNWYLADVRGGHDGGTYVRGQSSGSSVLFHREYMRQITGDDYECVDHVNGVATDCTGVNLEGVSHQ